MQNIQPVRLTLVVALVLGVAVASYYDWLPVAAVMAHWPQLPVATAAMLAGVIGVVSAFNDNKSTRSGGIATAVVMAIVMTISYKWWLPVVGANLGIFISLFVVLAILVAIAALLTARRN